MITNLVTFNNKYCQVFTHKNRARGELCRLTDDLEKQLDDLGIEWSYWAFRDIHAVIRIDKDDDISLLKLAYPLVSIAKNTFIDAQSLPVTP